MTDKVHQKNAVVKNHQILNGSLFLCGTLAAAACSYATAQGQGWLSALPAGILGMLAAGFFKLQFTRKLLSIVEGSQNFLVPAIFAICVRAGVDIWQVPTTWNDPFVLTGLAASLFSAIYILVVVQSLAVSGRHPKPLLAAAIIVIPFLFNGLLLIGTTDLVRRIGNVVLPEKAMSSVLPTFLGRSVILGLFNEALANLIGLLVVRRLVRDVRVHVLLLGSALLVSFTPELADWGSAAYLANLPWIAAVPAALVFAMLSQAGLWSQTFLVTGLIMDAFHGKQPTWYWGADHFRSGFTKGAVYSLVFISIVQCLAVLTRIDAVVALVVAHPIFFSALAGALTFPFLKTIIETFDGSGRFFQRAGRNYMEGVSFLRGAVLGAFCGDAFANNLPAADSYQRFFFGLLAGATGYGGVDIVRDIFEVLTGKRQRLQSWRVYALGIVLGGIAGGGLAWYADRLQLRVLTSKFFKYAALYYPAADKSVSDYIIYPLFSKWGALNLGHIPGGVRLLYNEALSGVINWSLAAPLFSINLVVLNALLQRSSAPLKELFTRKGVVGLIEQAVRVLRWGLWMAPIIYSFLRMSPDPTWYNQDGAIRTLIATYKSWTLDPQSFRTWSLHVFLNLLVYDWFRILIWVDHMGLRVATLVNLSFVGADILDEKAARAVGFSARTRCMPMGLRRFATWAPLLIPFYLPRGTEWNYVWKTSADRAAQLADTAWPPVFFVVGGFLLIASVLGLFFTLHRRRIPQTALLPASGAANGKATPDGGKTFVLSNGIYTTEVTSDGRGYSRVFSPARKGFEIDITRRPDDPLQMRGKFFYLRDGAGPTDSPENFWSIGFNPVRRREGEYRIAPTDPLALKMVAVFGGIRAEATLRLDETEPVELWQVRLDNLEKRSRIIELISYQEFGLNNTDAYRRHSFFNHLHIGTRFVRPMNALLAGNRLGKAAQKNPDRRRDSGETAFHAVKEDPQHGVTLIGYEDSRDHFIGRQSLSSPAGLQGDTRNPTDEGLCYTFDPIASLRLRVELPPLGSVAVTFVDGYGVNERQALERIAKHTGRSLPADFSHWSAFSRTRRLKQTVAEEKDRAGGGNGSLPYRFSADGGELSVGWATPRPWSHVMANPLGYGAVVSNQGAVYSFMKNSQQNGLTPFEADSAPSQLPGQVLYLLNLTTGETDTPAFIPFRRKDRSYDVRWGLGYAIYRNRSAAVELELSHFVLPDQPAEIRLLTIRNLTGDTLHYRVVPYWQIVLGETPVDTCGKIVTDRDRELAALFFSNPHNDFWRGWAFAATSLRVNAFETVRSRFLGGTARDLTNPVLLHNGTSDVAQPDDGLRCAAFVGEVLVPPAGEVTVSLVFGQTQNREQAAEIIRKFQDVPTAQKAFVETKQWWVTFLEKLKLQTGDAAFDRMINFWLPYQVLVARLWGRIGPYQRSGAFGFRDQLQDVLPFISLKPELARRQILLHSAQQFRQGDVLQWWHQSWEDETGIGAHGRASDPHLWLPYMVYQYVKASGDWAILDEETPYLEGRPLEKMSATQVAAQRPSRDTASLYAHCLKAIEMTLNKTGPHGLPLLGAGDWNDGLDAAGIRNRGESVWLGFFFHDILINFSDLVAKKEGQDRKKEFLAQAAELRDRLDATWLGDRYVNHYTDDGQVMARANALVTAWSIISGVAGPDKGRRAMATALQELEQADLVQLFTPPFTEHDDIYPGRLADYPPGVRENGGQYSHGVSWLVDALLFLSAEAQGRGETEIAADYRTKAKALWRKISPLSHLSPENMAVYGLPPHQQPADIYFGPGYEGRGGWSWYTGAAGRMLFNALTLLGMEKKGREVTASQDERS
jgi:cyclic beta-1,2-glucan synthetase